MKTGEEDEEAVFKQRCKLYRFDAEKKEWKEKGTGDIKVLKHKLNPGVFRLLMRRDQVLKLCVNHRVTGDLKFEVFNEKQVRWHAEDYSEGTGNHELLAARFKSEAEAKKFKEECEQAQKELAQASSTPPVIATKAPAKDLCQGLKTNMNEMFTTSNVELAEKLPKNG